MRDLRIDGFDPIPPDWLRSIIVLASPPDWLRSMMVGADGLEPPTLSV